MATQLLVRMCVSSVPQYALVSMGSGICQGMSWQHLHQPCVAGKVIFSLLVSLSAGRRAARCCVAEGKVATNCVYPKQTPRVQGCKACLACKDQAPGLPAHNHVRYSTSEHEPQLLEARRAHNPPGLAAFSTGTHGTHTTRVVGIKMVCRMEKRRMAILHILQILLIVEAGEWRIGE